MRKHREIYLHSIRMSVQCIRTSVQCIQAKTTWLPTLIKISLESVPLYLTCICRMEESALYGSCRKKIHVCLMCLQQVIKPACLATETSQNIEILHVESGFLRPPRKWITKALSNGPWREKTCLWEGLHTTKTQTSLSIRPDWSAPLL